MQENRASVTAWVNAYVRAYHALYDSPKIFDDSAARDLFADDEFAEMGKNLATSLQFFDPERFASCPDEAAALRALMHGHSAPIVISRARYTEDELVRAFERGVRQYVILGAGLDTFAFRRPESMRQLQVFELDHPSTQSFKRDRLSARNWKQPPHLHLIPIDLTCESPAIALARSPFDRSVLTFVNWLGVTYYLDREHVLDTLRAIASTVPKGSTVVFDYLDPGAFSESAPLRVRRMLEIVQRIGEPMKTSFDPTMLPADLERTGWRVVEDLSPAEIQERYFAGRSDGYRAFEHVRFARAEVI